MQQQAASSSTTVSSSSLVIIPQTIIRSYVIRNIHTDFVIQRFADRTFIGISQLKKGTIGTFISCNIEQSMIDQSTTFHISTLLGGKRILKSKGDLQEHVVLEVYARQISEQIIKLEQQNQRYGLREEPISLLLGISLLHQDDNEKDMFHDIVQHVIKLYSMTL